MFKAIVIYLSMFTGILLTVGGGYMIFTEITQPQGLLFEGLSLFVAGVTLLMIVMIASTIGKVIMLFDEILNQTTDLYEMMLKQERQKPKSLLSGLPGLSGMFNSVTIKNPDTGEETTTPIESDNISDSLDKINQAIIESIIKGPQEPEDSQKQKNPRKVSKKVKQKNLKNMNLGELEAELAESIKKDNYEKASEISILIENIKNPPPQEENKEE